MNSVRGEIQRQVVSHIWPWPDWWWSRAQDDQDKVSEHLRVADSGWARVRVVKEEEMGRRARYHWDG